MSSRRSRSGGSVNRDDVDPVEQVLAEPALGDRLGQVLVGRRDDADVGLQLLECRRGAGTAAPAARAAA